MKKLIKVLVFLLLAAMLLATMAQAEEITGGPVERLGGRSRIQTAITVSQEAYKNGTNAVVIASIEGKIDALTGTLLAAVKDAPLLLVEKVQVDRDLHREINRLGAKDIYILGGEKAISKEVEEALKKDKRQVKRIAGKNRAETAVKIAQEVKNAGFTTDHILIAEGYKELVDALVAGPVSAREKMPILLSKKDGLAEETKEALKMLGVKRATILGGEKAIGKAVESQLEDAGCQMGERISGSNRYETAVRVAERFFKDSHQGIIVKGDSQPFADALIGGYLAANKNAPILLAQRDRICSETEKYIENNCFKSFILGGEKAIKERVLKDVERAVKESDITIDKDALLEKNHKRLTIAGENIEVDLGAKRTKILEIKGSYTTIKNGQIGSLKIGEDVKNIILQDIRDNGQEEHIFAGGGGQSIILKGNTNLSSTIYITSLNPIRIRAEDLHPGQGIKGKVIIDTDAEVIIETPLDELQVIQANQRIKLRARVGKIKASAHAKIEVGKEIEKPSIIEDKGAKVSIITANTRPVLVSKITIRSEDSVVRWKTLQMGLSIQPHTANNKEVRWSIEEGTGSATIDSNGLLTAEKPGTVIVKALAKDGSGIEGTKEIKIIKSKLDNARENIRIPSVINIINKTGEKVELTQTFPYLDNTGKRSSNSPGEENPVAYFDKAKGILNLQNYYGGGIFIHSSHESDLIINLKGENIICTDGKGIYSGGTGNICITSENNGELKIGAETNDGEFSGLEGGYKAIYSAGIIEISGNANIEITFPNVIEVEAYGLYAKDDIFILEHSSLKTNFVSSILNSTGIFSEKDIIINTGGVINID